MRFIRLFLFLSIFSSLSIRTSAQLVQNKNIHNEYFPMQIGYTWYYCSYDHDTPKINPTFYDEKIEIKDSLFIKNKLFYMFESTYYNGNRIEKKDTAFFSVINDSLFGIHTAQKSIIVFWGKLSNEPQDFIMESNSDLKIRGHLKKQTNNSITIEYWAENADDFSMEKTFRKNIGIIDEHSNWGLGSRLIKYSFGNEKIE